MKKSNQIKNSEHAKLIIKIQIITMVINLFLLVSKTIIGVMYSNLSVISDAIHTASDFATSFLIIGAVFMSSPKRDKKYNYGHEKHEPLTTLFLAIVLAVVAGFLGWKGIQGIISPQTGEVNAWLIGIVALTVIIKEAMFWYEMYFAKKIKSDILKADAWHHRSDSLSSIAVLIGLVCSIFIGNNLVESIAVIAVALLIFKVAFDVFKPAMHQLTDRSANETTSNRIKEIAGDVDGVKSIDTLRTRMFGNKIFVDIEISVDKDLTVEQSHDIAQAVHDVLEATEELSIKHCMVHVNPHVDTLGGANGI